MTVSVQKGSNIRKTWLLIAVFLAVVIGAGWVFSIIYGNPLILYFAVIFSAVMNVVSYWYSDKIVLAMAKAKAIEKTGYPEIFEIIGRLAKADGLPMPKVYLIDEEQPNAFATGRNPEHAAVAVTKGLLQRLDKNELEGVLSHELSHVKNRDILVSTVVVVLVGFVSVISDIFLRSAIWGGFGRDRDNEGQSAFGVFGIILALLAPLAAILIQLAVSRKREFLADVSGAALTKNPLKLASALEKISSNQTQMKVARTATAHLWVASPFKGQKGISSITRLFMTHPPIEERVKILKSLKV